MRGLISTFHGDFNKWLHGAWVDIFVFLLMIGIAVMFWLLLKFRFSSTEIEIWQGLFNRRHTVIPWKNVTTATFDANFYLRPLHALNFRADTLGGSFKKSDFSILLTIKQSISILQSSHLAEDEAFGKVYQPTTLSIVALSLLTSNSFGGILFMSALISQSGKLLGDEFSSRIIGTFEDATRRLAFGVPPAAIALAYILLLGWLIGFSILFMRYKNFSVTKYLNTLGIISGVLSKKEYKIRVTDINFVDIRKSLVTKLLRLNTLYISAVGYGKHKNDISCIIPAENARRFTKSQKELFPNFSPSPKQFFPERHGFMRFVGKPIAALASIAAALVVFSLLYPDLRSFVLFVGFMAFVPATFFLIVCIFEFRTGGVAFENNCYTLRYSSGFTLHTVVIPKNKVVCVELHQSFFQKKGPYCDLIISSRAETRSLHCCKSLVKSDLIKLFEIK